MQFKAWEDVDAPLDYTFQRFTDFAKFEDAARDQGAEIRRVDNFVTPAEGVKWRGSVEVRGKTRGIEAELTRLADGEQVMLEARIGGMEVHYQMDFDALTDAATRVSVLTELKPRTLAARLIIQSAKLARGKIKQRIDGRLARFGNEVEADYQRIQSEAQS